MNIDTQIKIWAQMVNEEMEDSLLCKEDVQENEILTIGEFRNILQENAKDPKEEVTFDMVHVDLQNGWNTASNGEKTIDSENKTVVLPQGQRPGWYGFVEEMLNRLKNAGDDFKMYILLEGFDGRRYHYSKCAVLKDGWTEGENKDKIYGSFVTKRSDRVINFKIDYKDPFDD